MLTLFWCLVFTESQNYFEKNERKKTEEIREFRLVLTSSILEYIKKWSRFWCCSTMWSTFICRLHLWKSQFGCSLYVSKFPGDLKYYVFFRKSGSSTRVPYHLSLNLPIHVCVGEAKTQREIRHHVAIAGRRTVGAQGLLTFTHLDER